MAEKGIPTDLDKIAKMFSLPTIDEVEEMNVEYKDEAYRAGYDEAKSEGESDEKAEERAFKFEQAAGDEIVRNWHNAVTSVAEQLFGAHKLELVQRRKKETLPFEYYVIPTETWREAANEIRETINGVGTSHFSSLKEFLESGPYTPREAVENHLGYVRHYPEVYGTSSAGRIYESAWR